MMFAMPQMKSGPLRVRESAQDRMGRMRAGMLLKPLNR